ncbi:MAG TPA: hypothetical protein VK909_09235 [Anaerolineales bacterium]|nr:hypothetical protein [Anaerolineales bacterium]
MKANVSAKGYTNVLLILNMKRFVHPDDQARFERIRGREEFSHTLRDLWTQKLASQDKFITIEEDKRRRDRPEAMTAEQVGFATGVFRSLMLEKYTFPAYALDRQKIKFSDDLLSNFQFKTLFLRIWDKWSVYIRPTNTGFFVIRLTNRHRDQARSFIKLAQDVQRLQESLDIRSAQNWLRNSREKYADDPKILAVKENSVKAFLEWLGVDENYAGDVLYYPVQWRLAMEVCSHFVGAVGSQIYVNGNEPPIRLQVPKPSISIPLHDSYVVHHFTELLADHDLIQKSRTSKPNGKAQVAVDLNDIRKHPEIRQALVNLAEGAILKSSLEGNMVDTMDENTCFFPKHRWGAVDDLPNQNQATWNDELCLMNSRTAILLPSQKWRDHELLVSTVPSSTLRVNYHRYWGAIERMIEFVVEIRVMAQLLESASYDILVEISERIHQTQSKLFSGDIIMDERLPELVAQAAAMRHQAALCESLSHPQLWSRADFAISKADYLLSQLGVPRILQHIERNIDSTVEFVNHIDELYLADLSEKSNDNDARMSKVLAAASLTLTILILPSFWADIDQLVAVKLNYKPVLPIIEGIGDSLAIVLVISAFILFYFAFGREKKMKDTLQNLIKNRLKIRRRLRSKQVLSGD